LDGWGGKPSRFAVLGRHLDMIRPVDMSRPGSRTWTWLAAAVLVHLVVSIAHGAVHAEARVALSSEASLFVFRVILAGPLIGLALTWPAERVGGWLIAVTMAASLLFGLVNHFVVPSPDHVAHVAHEWRDLFAATAVLLVVTEALGTVLAIRFVRERQLA
jgi:hypothetical protein